MTLPLLPMRASQARLWAQHNSAAIPARQAGACVLCAAEAGCRATDRPGDNREPRLMHPECARRIARGQR